MSSVEETEAAVAGARTTGLPTVATLEFPDTNGRTMMGITPADLAGLHRKHQLAACGSNCGTGPSELVACIVNLATASDPSAILVAKANCGIPQFIDGEMRFNGTPELMGALRLFVAGCRRADHRRMLRHEPWSICGSCARRWSRMCAVRSRILRPLSPG